MGRIHIEPRYMPMIKLLRSVKDSQRIGETFFDWVHLVACALHSFELRMLPDKTRFEANEAEYLGVAKRYTREQLMKFAEAKAMLADALDPMDDVLGRMFEALELNNTWRGQFFTPYTVCNLMAKLSFGSSAETIQENGFITANDPACGGGAMMIGLADHMRDAGFNPQTQLHVQVQDIDQRCFHMAYVQLSLLGIPATAHLGNSLSREPPSQSWHTPFHVLHLWDHKLRRHYRELSARMDIPSEIQARWEQADPADRLDLLIKAGGNMSDVLVGLVPFEVRELLDDAVADRPPPPIRFPGFDLILANPPFGR